MDTINISFFKEINALAGESVFFDTFFVSLTNTVSYAVVIGVFVLLFIAGYLVHKNIFSAFATNTRLFYICISFILSWIVVELLKISIAFPRPFQLFQQLTVLAPYGLSDSFPSAHAALTTALAASVYYSGLYRIGIVLLFFALLVGFSRLYVGVHFPLDVLGGFLIGILVPLALFVILSKYKITKSQ